MPNSICAGPQVWPQKGWGPPAETATSPPCVLSLPCAPKSLLWLCPYTLWHFHVLLATTQLRERECLGGGGQQHRRDPAPTLPQALSPPTLPHPSSFSGETQWPAHPAATAQPRAGPSGSGHLPSDPQLRKAAPKLVELFPSVDAPESPHLASSEPEVLAQGLGGWGAGWWPGSWLLGLE